MKKILITTLIMMGAMVFAQETKTVTLQVEGQTADLKEILERDKRRAEWIQERVKESQEKAKEEKEVKEIKVDEPKAEKVKPEDKSPIVSQIITVNEMFNHRTIECFIDDWVVIRLNAQGGNRWELGTDQNGVLDFLMSYHNEKGKKPRVVSYDFDFDEEEPEIVEEREDKTISVRPFMPIVGMRPNSMIRRTPNSRPQNEVWVFEFQAMETGTEKITLKHVDTHMYIQMIGAPRPPYVPPFEITVKVKKD